MDQLLIIIMHDKVANILIPGRRKISRRNYRQTYFRDFFRLKRPTKSPLKKLRRPKWWKIYSNVCDVPIGKVLFKTFEVIGIILYLNFHVKRFEKYCFPYGTSHFYISYVTFCHGSIIFCLDILRHNQHHQHNQHNHNTNNTTKSWIGKEDQKIL